MSLDQTTIGERIACVSAVLLLASTFFDWFVVSIPENLGVDFAVNGSGQSAWDALDYIPIVLTISVGVVLILAAMRLMGRGAKPPVSTGPVIAILGAVSVLLIVFRIIDPPSVGSFQGVFGATAAAESTVEFGIFVGLLAAAGIAIGGCIVMKEEGVYFPRGRPLHHARTHLPKDG
jgi:hypothetical protein